MREKIDKALFEIEEFNEAAKDKVEAFRIKFLGQKGVIKDLFNEFKTLGKDQKRELGQQLNELKTRAQAKIDTLKQRLDESKNSSPAHLLDLTLPGNAYTLGSIHPISLVRNEIESIFNRMGFAISEGPEAEDDWHNFTALNFPEDHPARDMQDTFFVKEKDEYALRTHTSSVQIRVMENNRPPIRTISPGRVYRNEAISARAHCFFHQVEGLYVDKKVTFKDLKYTLLQFSKQMFGADTQIRLRPSYFPFTEPSAEMDISCFICNQEGCNVCKYTGWVEILGCGMVDPKVLENCKIDSNVFSGYAFGMGVERIAMLKFQVNDIRLFYENDSKLLEQFASYL